ncbi:nitrous oxide-stimulated promoter family protein [Paenibacillus sp. GCM10027629]|uniref:nitrous oxide-stimulated promoter family protein n=1 Tax=Paenibacillus sp. GCM10027629 TaxID=3273414 RepID=UPI003645F015
MGIVNTGPRIQQEKITVEQMIRIACRGKHHRKEELCDSCQQLLQYAHVRLNHCRFGEQKSTCGACPVHCYKPVKRQEIRAVMRYAGPRMVLHHPMALLRHTIHGLMRMRKK